MRIIRVIQTQDQIYPFHTRWLIGGMFAAFVMMLVAAWCDPQSRTQEARVLLGAREMLEGPPQRWIIPTANGEVRLNKPPLAYWLTAISQAIFGKSVLAGRLPAVMASTLTVGLTYLIGRRLFNARAGFCAAGALLGSWSLFRFGALAETDVLVMFFLVLAIYAMLRAGDAVSSRGWVWVIGICVGLIAMTKGPSAGYVVLLMPLIDAIDAKWKRNHWRQSLSWRFIASGSVLISLLIALPWFVVAFRHREGNELIQDLSNSARGGLGHAEAWWSYLPEILLAMMPWAFVWMIAGLASIRIVMNRKNADTDRRSLLILYAWGGAVLMPLMFWGNKQPHYLMSVLPALMLAVGWGMDRAKMWIPGEWISGATRNTLVVMLIATLFAGPAVVTMAWRLRGSIKTIDLTIGICLLCVSIMALVIGLRSMRGAGLACIASVILSFVLIKGVWSPTIEQPNAVNDAVALKTHFPNARFIFRDQASLTLCVAMQRIIPVMSDEQLIALAESRDRFTQVICLDEVEGEPLPLLRYRKLMRIESGEDDLVIFTPDVSAIVGGISTR